MAVLWIAHVDVKDAEAYGAYAKVATEVIPSHGGVFIARASAYKQLEGRDYPRNVIARFPDMASAEAAYADPAYQAVLPTAHGAAERSLVLVEIDD